MSSVAILRLLSDQQQFQALKIQTLHYLSETSDLQAKPLLALAYFHLGERTKSVVVVKEIDAKLNDLTTDAQIDLAAVYCLFWRIQEAVELLEPVVASEPKNSLAIARLAWCRVQQENLDAARELYQQSAELAPHRLPVWIALIKLHLESEDIKNAQQTLESAVEVLQSQHTEMLEQSVQLFTAQLRCLQLEIWITSKNLVEAEQWLAERREQLTENEWVELIKHSSSLLAGTGQHAAAEETLKEALKHYPEQLKLIYALSELAQLQGRTQQSIQLLRRLIALAKKQDKPVVGYWARLSNVCLHNFGIQARKAAEKADELVGEMVENDEMTTEMIGALRLQVKNALAQVECQDQNFDKSEELFNEVLAESPYFLPALQGLGQQQMQCGKIDEAIALFERIKEVDPAKGYSSLINVRRFPDDKAALVRIEKIARQPSMEGEVRSGLLLQLASAYEKHKEYDKAFTLASEANDASKKLLTYDPKTHRQRCARIRHRFSRELYQHRTDCGYRGEDESLPVFVLGMPRSGTTLVEQIIASHSQIFGAGELGLIPSRIQGLNRWERHIGSGRHYPDNVDDLSPYVVKGIAKGILTELKELAEDAKPDAKFVVDKLPHNFENVGLIKFIFPKAKIISVRRDPRDIAVSNFFTDYQAKHGGMGFAYDLEWIGEQLADHNLLMHHWQQVFPNEILEINYEDVVEDTEGQARRLLDYIGVEWEPQVLAFNELDRPVKTASVWQVRQPIYKSSTAKWMRYQNHLAKLIQGTNKRIEWDVIDMLNLPEPAMLQTGVELFNQQKMDEAEYEFKKLLHHIPDHAAANFMVGTVYAVKGHLQEAIALMEKGVEKCPWNKNWRNDLIQAYEMADETEKAEDMKNNTGGRIAKSDDISDMTEQNEFLTTIEIDA